MLTKGLDSNRIKKLMSLLGLRLPEDLGGDDDACGIREGDSCGGRSGDRGGVQDCTAVLQDVELFTE